MIDNCGSFDNFLSGLLSLLLLEFGVDFSTTGNRFLSFRFGFLLLGDFNSLFDGFLSFDGLSLLLGGFDLGSLCLSFFLLKDGGGFLGGFSSLFRLNSKLLSFFSSLLGFLFGNVGFLSLFNSLGLLFLSDLLCLDSLLFSLCLLSSGCGGVVLDSLSFSTLLLSDSGSCSSLSLGCVSFSILLLGLFFSDFSLSFCGISDSVLSFSGLLVVLSVVLGFFDIICLKGSFSLGSLGFGALLLGELSSFLESLGGGFSLSSLFLGQSSGGFGNSSSFFSFCCFFGGFLLSLLLSNLGLFQVLLGSFDGHWLLDNWSGVLSRHSAAQVLHSAGALLHLLDSAMDGSALLVEDILVLFLEVDTDLVVDERKNHTIMEGN